MPYANALRVRGDSGQLTSISEHEIGDLSFEGGERLLSGKEKTDLKHYAREIRKMGSATRRKLKETTEAASAASRNSKFIDLRQFVTPHFLKIGSRRENSLRNLRKFRKTEKNVESGVDRTADVESSDGLGAEDLQVEFDSVLKESLEVSSLPSRRYHLKTQED
jgi:hypothetical protein